ISLLFARNKALWLAYSMTLVTLTLLKSITTRNLRYSKRLEISMTQVVIVGQIQMKKTYLAPTFKILVIVIMKKNLYLRFIGVLKRLHRFQFVNHSQSDL